MYVAITTNVYLAVAPKEHVILELNVLLFAKQITIVTMASAAAIIIV
jgi:hypothetical protein